MRRKSTRASTAASTAATESSTATQEKVKEDKRKGRRSTRRRKASTSESDSDEDVALSQLSSKSSTKSETTNEEGIANNDSSWTVCKLKESTDGDKQKLKLCITRSPSKSPEKAAKRMRGKSSLAAIEEVTVVTEEKPVTRKTRKQASAAVAEDNASVEEQIPTRRTRKRSSSVGVEDNASTKDETPARRVCKRSGSVGLDESAAEEKPSRRTRRQLASPIQEEAADEDEVVGKGKSKGKTKTKKDDSNEANEKDNQSEISDNVQVTTQSPQKDDIKHDKEDVIENSVTVINTSDSNVVKNAEADEGETAVIAESAECKKEEMPAVEEELVESVTKKEKSTISENGESSDNEQSKKSESTSDCGLKEKEIHAESAEKEDKESKDENKIIEVATMQSHSPKEEPKVETEEIDEEAVHARQKIQRQESKDAEDSIELTLTADECNMTFNEPESKGDNSQSTQPEEEDEPMASLSPKPLVWDSIKSQSLYEVQEVTTDSLKEIFPNIAMLNEVDVKLEHSVRERRISLEKKVEVKLVEEKKTEELTSNTNSESAENSLAFNRKISIVNDEASHLKPPPSPAKNEKSTVLFIINLVRPFTLKQLRELLERTGTIKDEGFWTDKIKSKCYVEYESMEEAEATRNALHGVHWPIGNGKKLIIEYSTTEEMELAKNPPEPPAQVLKSSEATEKENVEPESPMTRKVLQEPLAKEEEQTQHHSHLHGLKGESEEPTIRRSRSNDKFEHKRRRSRSRSYEHKKKIREEPVPQKAMDDLFRKTEATPCIYWQPLSPEEIALKQQQRLERMAEHKRRMETQSSRTSKRGSDYPRSRGGGYRRRY